MSKKTLLLVALALGALLLAVGLGSHLIRISHRAETAIRTRQRESPLKPGFLSPRPIGNPSAPNQGAWITDLTIADLDQDGLKDVIWCDGRLNRICWIRQVRPGVYEEQQIGDTVAGPAHVEVVDIDGDGDLDILVAGMGVIFPSNEKTGSVVILENDGQQHFTNHVILDKTYRVTYVGAGDLNGDGKLDLAVGQFGYYAGQVQWLENLGNWRFAEHPLLDLAGAIHTPIVDLDGDGKLDMVALISQDWEEVYAFANQGGGAFKNRILYGSTNKDYGSSGLCVADVDRDGHPDIVYTNGDGFDYAAPGSRPWHGVQWLRNDRRGKFTFHRVVDFPGAFSPLVVDLNGDGYADIVAVGGFNDRTKPDAVSLICVENDGNQAFTPRPLAYAPTHMVVVKGADMKNNRTIELVTGGFAFYPPYDRAARVTLWERSK